VKNRLFALTVLALCVALALPSGALAYQWTKSPVNPLIKGGVHSKAKFRQLLTSSGKVRAAVRGVAKVNKTPSWVFGAAVKEAAAGDIHSASLNSGAHIGAMGFGLKTTKIVNNTVWAGKGRLPYYYVEAANSVTEGGFVVTTIYKVCLSKTCANPFIIGRRITRTPVANSPQVYNLYIETRENTDNIMIGGVEVTGTVGALPISVETTDSAPTLIGQFPAGTTYNLTEVTLPSGYMPYDPASGNLTGTMPASDLTLTFINGLD
jgi:hypothetical protein